MYVPGRFLWRVDALSRQWNNVFLHLSSLIHKRKIQQTDIAGKGKESSVSARTGGALTGQIKMVAGEIAANTIVGFVFLNDAIEGGDNILMIHGGDPDGGDGEDFGDYAVSVTGIVDGEAEVFVENISDDPLDQQIFLTFTILKQGVE